MFGFNGFAQAADLTGNDFQPSLSLWFSAMLCSFLLSFTGENCGEESDGTREVVLFVCFQRSVCSLLLRKPWEQSWEQCQGQEALLSWCGDQLILPYSLSGQRRITSADIWGDVSNHSLRLTDELCFELTSFLGQVIPLCQCNGIVNNPHLTNEHICSCVHKVQEQVKEWRPSIFNSFLTWFQTMILLLKPQAAPPKNFLLLFCL